MKFPKLVVMVILWVFTGCTMGFLTDPPQVLEPVDYVEEATPVDSDGDGLTDRQDWVMHYSQALVKYQIYQYDQAIPPQTKKLIRTDEFNAGHVSQWVQLYSYEGNSRVQTRFYSGTGVLEKTERVLHDAQDNKIFTAIYDVDDKLSTYTTFYYDTLQRIYRTAVFSPDADGVLGLQSQIVNIFEEGDAGRLLKSLNFSGLGAVVSGKSWSYRNLLGDDQTLYCEFGASGVLTTWKTWQYKEDFIPDALPVYDFPLNDFTLVVEKTFSRSLRAIPVIPNIEAAYALLPLPEAPQEPATPTQYTLETPPVDLKAKETVINAGDPYGFTKVTLDALTLNPSDQLPAIAPDHDIPFLPRQIYREDNRIEKSITVDLVYDTHYRLAQKTTKYGTTTVLDLKLEYGTTVDEDEYLLTKVALTGAILEAPLTFEIIYDNKFPVKLVLSTSGTALSTFEFLYSEIAGEVPTLIKGFDPVKVGQDPLAFGSQLLKILKTGWKIRHLGPGANPIPAAEYAFSPVTDPKPGLKIEVNAYDRTAQLYNKYQGYYLLSLDTLERAAKFESFKGTVKGSEVLDNSMVYNYGEWGDKLFEYKDQVVGLATDAKAKLEGSALAAYFGYTPDDFGSLLIQFFK